MESKLDSLGAGLSSAGTFVAVAGIIVAKETVKEAGIYTACFGAALLIGSQIIKYCSTPARNQIPDPINRDNMILNLGVTFNAENGVDVRLIDSHTVPLIQTRELVNE